MVVGKVRLYGLKERKRWLLELFGKVKDMEMWNKRDNNGGERETERETE